MRRAVCFLACLVWAGLAVLGSARAGEPAPPSSPPSPSPSGLFEPRKLSAQEQAKVDAHPLGSRKNPVRCDGPDGERAYVERLRCPTGDAPKFNRGGAIGPSPYGTMMDAYYVRCPEWQEPRAIAFDMYHDRFLERRAVVGFTIVAAEGRKPSK